MGYYSDVALCLSLAGAQKLEDELAKVRMLKNMENQEDMEQIESFFDSSALKVESEDAVLYVWKRLKWYEHMPAEFPHIHFTQDFVNQLEPQDFLFMRIGEEIEDIEEKGMYFDNPFEARLSLKIEFG